MVDTSIYHSTLDKLESEIAPKTLHQFNDRLVALGQIYHIIRGYRLRVDSSVTESNIRYPMDNYLLSDGVRVLSRLIERTHTLLPIQMESAVLYSDHTLIAKRRCKLIARLIHSLKSQKSQKKRRKTEKALNKAYKELVDITNITLTQARKVVQALQDVSNEQVQRIVHDFLEFIPLVERVVEQTTQRVFQNKRVPAELKVVSLFEPHTQIIQKGKGPPHETEFGHKVNYGESDGKFVIHWQVVLEYNPPDDKLLPATLLHHCKLFGHAPHLLATDSGMFSPENENLACELGVEQIAIARPKRFASKKQDYRKESWFRKGQRFRNGIEGRISVLHRTVHLSRCPYRGIPGFERWIGWGIITANLVVMARSLRKRKRKTMKK